MQELSDKANNRGLRPSGVSSGTPKKLPRKRLGQRLTRRQGVKRADEAAYAAADGGLRERQRLVALADNGYQEINASWTITWLRHRLREYVSIHGYASAGVCALLERAAEQYADGDFLRGTAASKGGDDLPEMLHQAARHATLARSHELAAWELASREGVAKRAIEDAAGNNRNGKLAAIIAEVGVGIQEGQPWGGVGAGELEQIEGGMTMGEATKPRPAQRSTRRRGRSKATLARLAQENDPASPDDSPRGVEGQGPPSPSAAPETNPLFGYCNPCRKHFRLRGNTEHCTRCGVLAEPASEPESAFPSPEVCATVSAEDVTA